MKVPYFGICWMLFLDGDSSHEMDQNTDTYFGTCSLSEGRLLSVKEYNMEELPIDCLVQRMPPFVSPLLGCIGRVVGSYQRQPTLNAVQA